MKTRPRFKMCRRVGAPIFEQCQTQRFIQSEAKRGRATSSPNAKRPKPLSDYGQQLLEKQKVRFSYGITERQLANYVKTATATKGGTVTDKLYSLLEMRLDNVIYRLGLAHTRRFARQLVSHGHITVGGKRINVPSYQVRVGDVIVVREGSRGSTVFADFAKRAEQHTVPNWLTLVPAQLTGTVKGTPKHDDPFMKLETVLEFYSR
ncbi:MAG TPA: 30S ribosomal protein S4 [Candidatus Paceibacterota bacterium]|nr:30S ribosomal protein S4 [Candidatus Paceibacterota bacterium]